MDGFDAPTADLQDLPVLYLEDEAARFCRRLNEWVSRIVWISGRVPGVQAFEDDLEQLLAMIEQSPEMHVYAEREFARYLHRLAEPAPDSVLVEVLEFCSATLRFRSVLELAQQLRQGAASRYEMGDLRAWDVMRSYDLVIEAYSDNWDSSELYRRYRRP